MLVIRTFVLASELLLFIYLLISAKVFFSFFYIRITLVSSPIQIVLVTMINWENDSFKTLFFKVPVVPGFLKQKPYFANFSLNILWGDGGGERERERKNFEMKSKFL